jgi:PleD family two-component response regulator
LPVNSLTAEFGGPVARLLEPLRQAFASVWLVVAFHGAMVGTDMRVLLIEDDSATAQSIELMLKSENFNVYTTDLGEEGIDLGKLYDYDIILLDLTLPDMNGFEVLKQLRVARVVVEVVDALRHGRSGPVRRSSQ